MTLTVNLPDEYAAFLPSGEADLVAVLSAGLRRWRGSKKHEIADLQDVAETLASLPSPEEVLAIHPSAELAERTATLLEKSKTSGFTTTEQAEWDDIMQVEHLVRVAKAKALARLKADGKAA